MKKLLLGCMGLALVTHLIAQSPSPASPKFQPFVMLQLWGTYSHDYQVYDEDAGTYKPVDDRFNIQIRRARVGLRGQPYENLKFSIVSSFDLIGRDALSGTIGGYNPATPKVGIWDAFLQWNISKGSEFLHLTGGFFRPQFSRESITSGWSVNSFEKSMSQNYIRRHLVGSGPGRALGLNLGGLLLGDHIGLTYNVGIFNPLTTGDKSAAIFGNTVGTAYAPLWVGRAVLYIGDPEQNAYKIGYDINYFHTRKGISLGISGSSQRETGLFSRSQAVEADILLNYAGLSVDGEWIWMEREGLENQQVFPVSSQTGHIRAGYSVKVGDTYFVEPVGMVMHFKGPLDAEGQAQAKSLNAFSGTETTYDVGVNWYLNRKKLKLMLHYTWHQGDPGAAGDGATVNQFFSQSEVGAIRRGDWLGLGVNLIY